MFDEERTFTFPPNAETRNYMVYFGHGHARDYINKHYKLYTLQKL